MAPKAKAKSKPAAAGASPSGGKGAVEKTAAAAPASPSAGPTIEELFKTLERQRKVETEDFKQVIKISDQSILSPRFCFCSSRFRVSESDASLSVRE